MKLYLGFKCTRCGKRVGQPEPPQGERPEGYVGVCCITPAEKAQMAAKAAVKVAPKKRRKKPVEDPPAEF